METENKAVEVVAEVKEAKVEEVKETKVEAEVVKETTTEVKAAEVVDTSKEFVALLEKALTEAVEKVTVKRGLVENAKESKEAEKSLKDLSLGELAIKSGFFK